MKLTRIATALAIKIGSKRTCAAKTSAVVLTINPTMPDTTKVAYARQPSFRPDSAANVIEEFRMYDPVAATSHEIILAAINNNVSGLLQAHRSLNAVNSAT